MKRGLTAVLLAALTLALVCAPALADGTRVYDRAELFSASEEKELAGEIERFQKDTGMDFVIVTSDEAHGDASQQQIADEFTTAAALGWTVRTAAYCTISTCTSAGIISPPREK